MNITDNDIRLAMERRLSALDQNAARRARILRIIEHKEEPIMIKKLSWGLTLAIALILIFAAVALALTTNLFHLYGERNEMYEKIADRTQLLASEPLALEDDGALTARFDSALYDGMTLNAALIIDRQTLVREYAPEEDELSSMRIITELPVFASDGTPEMAQAQNALLSAIEAGAPIGYRVFKYYPSDHVFTDDGVEIPPFTGDPMIDDTDRYVEMRTFKPPLPDELRDLDAITLNCAITRYEDIWYFDGEKLYHRHTAQDAGVIRATAPRSEGGVITMSGAIDFEGAALTARAEVSVMCAVVTIEASEYITLGDLTGARAVIPPEIDPFDIWANIAAYDERGRAYIGEYFFEYPKRALPVTQVFSGVGELPERLEIHIFPECEGDTEINAQPFIITLMPSADN